LKKIVVNDESENHEFEGKQLKVIEPEDINRLVIMDGSENIASFNYWRYWRKLE